MSVVTLEDVRHQLTTLGYTDVPDSLVRDFLKDINTSSPSRPASPAPRTPARNASALAYGDVGPWAAEQEGDEPAPVSPFDDGRYDNFPIWPDESVEVAAADVPREQAVPPSPPFDVHVTPSRTATLRTSKATRVTMARTAVPRAVGTKKTTPRATARNDDARMPGGTASPLKISSRAVSTTIDTSATPDLPTGSPPRRHVSGTSVIYAQMSTAKERANKRGMGFRKSDPVRMYQQHARAWASDTFLGSGNSPRRNKKSAQAETARRGQGTARPSTARTARQQQGANGNSTLRSSSSSPLHLAPTEKRRDNLR